MKFPGRDTVERLRKQYTAGTRVALEYMDDEQAPPTGMLGTVLGVDDIGSIMVKWDNGSMLSVADWADRVRVIRTCPLCGKDYTEPHALSRKDNQTEICPECGIRKALKVAEIAKDKKKTNSSRHLNNKHKYEGSHWSPHL